MSLPTSNELLHDLRPLSKQWFSAASAQGTENALHLGGVYTIKDLAELDLAVENNANEKTPTIPMEGRILDSDILLCVRPHNGATGKYDIIPLFMANGEYSYRSEAMFTIDPSKFDQAKALQKAQQMEHGAVVELLRTGTIRTNDARIAVASL